MVGHIPNLAVSKGLRVVMQASRCCAPLYSSLLKFHPHDGTEPKENKT